MTETILSPQFLATLDQLALVTRAPRVGTFKGERRSPRRGGSVEFADYREYVPGDDFRQVDWNAYARMEKLFLRLFVEEEDATVHLLLDASSSMQWADKWIYAQKLAAALGYIALLGMDRLSAAALAVSGRDLTLMRPLRGKSHALQFFDWLESLQAGGTASPDAALAKYAAQARRAGPLLLIGDLMDDAWRAGIQRLSASNYEITILHLLAPDELEPALEGDLRLLDSETNATVEITADYDLLDRYRTRVRAWQAEWARYCTARGIYYLPISTSQDFQELVLGYLRRHQILK